MENLRGGEWFLNTSDGSALSGQLRNMDRD